MQKILLINPPPFHYVEPYYDLPEYPRTAIAYLSGFLRERNIDVHVLDCKYNRLKYVDSMEIIKHIHPDIIGLGAFTNEIKPAARLAKMIKDFSAKIITIIGGVHVSALPEETLREFPEFDYGVVGEGEETLHELVNNIGNHENIKSIKGVAFLDHEGKYHFGGHRYKIAELDAIPFPAWDMFKPAKEYIVHTSRGCPFSCNFCMNPNGRIVRHRSPQNVLDEIEWIQTFAKPTSILFGDEIFTLQRPRVVDILNGYISRGYHHKIAWWCQTHVGCIDFELAQLMKKSNCRQVGLGIESGNEEHLKASGKNSSRQLITDAVTAVKKAKLPFMTFFILGQPNETIESARDTIQFAIDLNPTYPVFGLMVPYPGTKIAQMVKNGEGGYISLSEDWNDYNKQIGNALAFKNIPRIQLEKLQFWGYLKVFIFNYRFWDLIKFIWKYRVEGFSFLKKQFKFMASGVFILKRIAENMN